MSIFYVTCARGLTSYVSDELTALGMVSQEEGNGVQFEGDAKDAYNACLWIRCGSRILLELRRGVYKNLDDLYQQLSAFPWSAHMKEEDTFATHVTTRNAGNIHTHYAALRVKDAIADYFINLAGVRPDVDTDFPMLRFHVHLTENRFTLYLDLSGEPLHKRGYRTEQGIAPIKENLAAALLYRSKWPEKAKNNDHFIDPLCGAGTILIEAALMAHNIAPGLYRKRYGFMNWRQFKEIEWTQCLQAAEIAAEKGRVEYQGKLLGIEHSARMIGITKANADRAKVLHNMIFAHQPFQEYERDECFDKGLIVTNPPYGERLGEKEELVVTYSDLGDWLRQYKGFEAGVITSDVDLGRVMGLRAKKINKFFNGALDCTYLQFEIEESCFVDRDRANARQAKYQLEELLADGGEDFKNRLTKNKRHFERWAKTNGITCFRLYDADLPEFNVAIDRYQEYMVVYEYAPPKTIDADIAKIRLEKIMNIIPLVFEEINPKHIYLKKRERQHGHAQYEKQGDERFFIPVQEGSAKLLVNLTDYLDTGLFLDHRMVRQKIYEMARHQRFLNLFAYTGTATVHAANGGANTTMTIDMSNTYIKWAERNMQLNEHKGKQHIFLQAEVFEWIEKHINHMRRKPLLQQREDKFDLIFMDPPSFSNSKRMENILDIQRDHVHLISQAMRILDRGGMLIFSTNLRKFKLDEGLSDKYIIEDISYKTIPEDFNRNHKIRKCFLIKQ